MHYNERFVMNKSYQFVSESLNLQEGILGQTAKYGSMYMGAGTLGVLGWILNEKIRTKKVLSAYPTPESMKRKLETSPERTVRMIASTLTPDMSQDDYEFWVKRNVNPRSSLGKMIMTQLKGPYSLAVQLLKAGVHSMEDGENITNRAIRKHYGMFNM